MANATDLHVDLLKWENRSMHHTVAQRFDTQDEALLRLTEMVAENERKLDAIIEHLGVEYEKPSPDP